ncbi:MAG: hypothetical protein ACRDYC_00575 [Acidimicrobiales bacterium]
MEDHGRVITTNREAAAFYRQAQQAVDSLGAHTALRLAVEADPGFALGVADLKALGGVSPSSTSGGQMNWERHHIEVVRTAVAGNLARAADLLREHVASVGCDPLAVSIVTDLARRSRGIGGIEDLARQLPGCHVVWRSLP